MLKDERDVSNYLGVNIKKKSYEAFELLQLHLVNKIINHVRLTVSASLNCRETSSGKSLLHKDESSLGRQCVWNYRAVVIMLSCIWGSTQQEISMVIHQCAQFFNNPCLVDKCAVRRISKYLARTSTGTDLSDGNIRLYTCEVVYRTVR